MVRDRSFNTALLVSLVFHLLCMFGVTIIVLPAGFPTAKTSNISFLGPLFEKTAFELMVEQTDPLFKADYASPHVIGFFDVSASGGLKDKFLLSADMDLKQDGAANVEIEDLLGDFKIVPGYVFQKKEEIGTLKPDEDFLIEGPLSRREILYRPDSPKIAKRMDQALGSFLVELSFVVQSSGRVDEVVPVVSSGYPDVDLAAIRYIRGFQFAPSKSKENKALSGKIKITLRSR